MDKETKWKIKEDIRVVLTVVIVIIPMIISFIYLDIMDAVCASVTWFVLCLLGTLACAPEDEIGLIG